MKKFVLWALVFVVSFMSFIEVVLNYINFEKYARHMDIWSVLFILTFVLSIFSFIMMIIEVYSKKNKELK